MAPSTELFSSVDVQTGNSIKGFPLVDILKLPCMASVDSVRKEGLCLPAVQVQM